MRHLSTEELLLYAEGELEDRELCRHVPDCVDCKAQMVDLQETYVHATSDLLAQTRHPFTRPTQLHHFRARLAAEAELLAVHLSTEDLLLSVEDSLGTANRAHLSACGPCRSRAAEIHVQLAEIEYALHRQTAFVLPAERRAAALVALRAQLKREVKRQKAEAGRHWNWLPRFSLPRAPAFASYAAAFAAACLLAWVGWNAVSPPERPAPAPVAEAIAPEAVASDSRTAIAAREMLPLQPLERFELASANRALPAPMVALVGQPAPAVEALDFPLDSVAIELPQRSDLPTPPTPAANAFAVPLPARIAPPAPDSPDSAIEGNWILARTGLWKESLQAGGSNGRLRFTGSVANESDRLRIESALRAAADGRPVDFSISVRGSRKAALQNPLRAAVGASRPAGGLVRNSLLQHYEDSARRSFQPLDASLLENELNRYVTGVMRDDAELLAHVHALHSMLNRTGIDEARRTDRLRQVLGFHLDAIAKYEKEVGAELSEALERTNWNYRSAKRPPEDFDSLGGTSRELLKDALALDRALTAMFFGISEPLDARAGTLSVGTLLSRIRHHTQRLKKEIRNR